MTVTEFGSNVYRKSLPTPWITFDLGTTFIGASMEFSSRGLADVRMETSQFDPTDDAPSIEIRVSTD